MVAIALRESRTLHDQIGTENTHGGDTNTRLGGTVGGTQAGENNGAGAAHSTEEGLYHVSIDLGWVRVCCRRGLEWPVTG